MDNLLIAERQIVDDIKQGIETDLGGGLPESCENSNLYVRACFITSILKGSLEGVSLSPKGLRVSGAIIVGDEGKYDVGCLDLENYCVKTDIALINSLFLVKVSFQRGEFKSIFLIGSSFLRGLNATGATISGDLNLSKIQSNIEIGIVGCSIEGDLNCSGMKLRPGNGSDAFSADRAEIRGVLHLCDNTEINGNISFAGASVALLDDDPECWPSTPNSMYLDGFTYGRFIGTNAEVNAKVRISWLKKLNHTIGFKPQQYEHLAKIYKRDGQRSFYRAILEEKEKLQRKAHQDYLLNNGKKIMAFRQRIVNVSFEYTLAFGYRPSITLRWLASFFVIGWVVFGIANGNRAFKPNDSRVWLSSSWAECIGETPSQVDCFMEKGGASYPTFNAFIYSADVLLPIVDLDMQDTWIPDEDKSPWVRRYMWIQIALGWFFSLLAVVGFSGLIKPE